MFSQGKKVAHDFDKTLEALIDDEDQSFNSIEKVASKFDSIDDQCEVLLAFEREKSLKADCKLEAHFLELWRYVLHEDRFGVEDVLQEIFKYANISDICCLDSIFLHYFDTHKAPFKFGLNETSELRNYRAFFAFMMFFKSFVFFLTNQNEKDITRIGAKFKTKDMDMCGETGNEQLINACYECCLLYTSRCV